MLRPRIIPCLLISDNGLVKTEVFSKPKYVGDPLNAVKIFNEKNVDEIMVIDIDATVKKKEPNYKLIESIASECRMPLSYGGGINNREQAIRITALGVEKVCLSSEAINRPSLISEISSSIGSQSTVVVLDTKKRKFTSKLDVYIHNGKINTKQSPLELAIRMQEMGCGEIVINSIDRDGMLCGYDLDTLQEIYNETFIPITTMGGAGDINDLREALVRIKNPIGLAAGSLFTFRGKYKAVLINYPSEEEKNYIIEPYTRSKKI